MTKKYGWTKNILIHQIEGQSYEKYLLNQTNFDKSFEAKYRHQAKLAVRDRYNFDFLELGQDYDERELDGEEYFIDLLLYHRSLKCLVAIE